MNIDFNNPAGLETIGSWYSAPLPFDAKDAQYSLEEKGKIATKEQLYELCKRLLDNALAVDNVVFSVLDWAQTLSDNFSKTDNQQDREAVSMKPKIVINKDFEWFQKNYSILKNDFPNQWVAIVEQKVVCHGDTFIDVLSDARKQGYKRPFITKVLTKGWGQK